MNPLYEVLVRELNNFVLTSINYEIIVYEDIKDYHLFYKYPLLTFKRDKINYFHTVKERKIKFNSENSLVNYYYEKGDIEIDNHRNNNNNCMYLPLIDKEILVEIYRKKNSINLYVIDSYSIVIYNYGYKESFW